MRKKSPQWLHSGELALATNESASCRFLALLTRPVRGLKNTYHSRRFPVLVLAALLVMIAACITVYVRQQRRSMENTVATVQRQAMSYPLQAKDQKLDEWRIKLFIQPPLRLFVLIGLIPALLFVLSTYKNPNQHRGTMMSYGFVLMLASVTLVGVCYISDYTAFYALTEQGYARLQKHYNMMVWSFTFFPGALGANLFVSAMMKES